MKRLIILCIVYPLSVISGPCMSRPEPQGMRIEAILYNKNDKSQLSEDHENYYRNNQGEYDRGAVSSTSALDTNRITIDKVIFDSQEQLAKISYYVRLGKGMSAYKGSAEVKFGKSSIQSWDANKEVKLSSTYISGNIEMTDK
jgi:hypothetical protein